MTAAGVPWLPFPREAPRAIVNAPSADVRREPAHESEMLTQALIGAVVSVEETADEGKWVRARFDDGYAGWIRSWLLVPAGEEEAGAWRTRGSFRVGALRAFVRREPESGADIVAPVTALGRLALLGRAPGGLWCEVLFPDGRRGWISSDAERPYFEPSGAPAEDALRAARGLLGVPYLWGGTTPAALDCSGLTWIAWGLAGVELRRDAAMQAEDAAPVTVEEARPGDLLFFGEPEGRIGHVAIVETERRFLHAQGFVRRGSLDPSAPDFHPRLASLLRGAGRTRGPRS